MPWRTAQYSRTIPYRAKLDTLWNEISILAYISSRTTNTIISSLLMIITIKSNSRYMFITSWTILLYFIINQTMPNYSQIKCFSQL